VLSSLLINRTKPKTQEMTQSTRSPDLDRPRTKPKRKKIGKRKTPAADCRCTSSLPPRLHPMSSLAPAPRRSRFLGFELNSDEPVVVVVVRILASSSLASVRREENASPGRMSRRRSSPAPLDDDEQPS
jgi:hypothetical protein